MYISVAKYAERAGISTVAAYKRIKAGKLTEYIAVNNGKTLINEEVFNDYSLTSKPTVNQKLINQVNQVNNQEKELEQAQKEIEELKATVDRLQADKDKLDNQVNKLLDTLYQQAQTIEHSQQHAAQLTEQLERLMLPSPERRFTLFRKRGKNAK